MKRVKTLPILLGASFLLLVGCVPHTRNYDVSDPDTSLHNAPVYYGDKLPKSDFRDAGFTHDQGYVFNRDYRDGCIFFSNIDEVHEYVTSMQEEANEIGESYENAFNQLNSLTEEYLSEYYFVMTPQIVLGNSLYSLSFDALYLDDKLLTVRIIESKSEGTVPEVCSFCYFKVAVLKKYNIDSVRLVISGIN